MGSASQLVQIELQPPIKQPKPSWLRAKAPVGDNFHNLKKLARGLGLRWTDALATLAGPFGGTKGSGGRGMNNRRCSSHRRDLTFLVLMQKGRAVIHPEAVKRALHTQPTRGPEGADCPFTSPLVSTHPGDDR